MINIVKGKYKSKELAELLGINSKNIKRDMEKFLKGNGYVDMVDYNLSQRGYCIFYRDLVLSTMNRKDRNMKILLYCIATDEHFNTMPWVEKPNYLKDKFDIDISDRTLRNMRNILIDNGFIEEDITRVAIWCTEKDGRNENFRYEVDIENDLKYKEWKEYIKRRDGEIKDELKNEYKEYSELLDERNILFPEVWNEFRRNYRRYYGYSIKIGKIDEVKEIIVEIKNSLKGC